MQDQFDPALLKVFNSKVLSTSDLESVSPGSIPGGRISKFFFFSFFPS